MQHPFTRLGMALSAAGLISLAACSGGNPSVPAVTNGTQSYTAAQPQNVFQTAQSAVAQSASQSILVVRGGPHDRAVRVSPNTVGIHWNGASAAQSSMPWTNGTMYVSDYTDGTVNVYSVNNHQYLGQGTGFTNPNGMAYSSAFNVLAIANQGADQIVIVGPGPSNVLADPEPNPIGVQFIDGNLYVANLGCPTIYSGCDGTHGGAMFYTPRSPNPIRMRGGPAYVWSVTRDPDDNIWAIGLDANNHPLIGYWNQGTIKNFNPVNIAFTFPGDIAFDGDGYLLLDDQLGATNGGAVVNVYYPNIWAKIQSFNIQNDGSDVIHFQETRNWKIFAADASDATARWYNYPNDTFLGQLSSPNAVGITVIL